MIVIFGENYFVFFDVIVLFDGGDLVVWDNVDNWKVEDGVMVVGCGDICFKEVFGDC